MEGSLKERLRGLGQEHLLQFWDELDGEGKSSLSRQIQALPLEEACELHRSFRAGGEAKLQLSEAPVVGLGEDGEEEAKEAGEEALREGRVAALVVAGGQGTRLGFDGPKGAFPMGPVTKRTLFRVHAEKLLALRRRYGSRLPFYVMTSEMNRSATEEFWRAKGDFGLGEEGVRFFTQGSMPAMDMNGRMLLERPDRVFASPDGHGGVVRAVARSGALREMRERGVEYVFYFQVDNPLVRVCDPGFLGRHIGECSEFSLKVVRKRDAAEKLGVWALRDGAPAVVEYSDIPPELASSRLPDGTLRFWAGSIAIHVFSVSFLDGLARENIRLPFHRATKRVNYVERGGGREGRCVKFESFVFDALIYARKSLAVETTRDEFSPVKNAAGEDSVGTARADMIELYAGWLEACGVTVPRDEKGRARGAVEISALAADSAEELRKRIAPDLEFRDGLVIGG